MGWRCKFCHPCNWCGGGNTNLQNICLIMALHEHYEYTLEIIPPHNIINCRKETVIDRDGVEIAREYHRMVHVPGSDLSMACDEVKAVAGALWTVDSVAAYEAAYPPAPSVEEEVTTEEAEV